MAYFSYEIAEKGGKLMETICVKVYIKYNLYMYFYIPFKCDVY